MTIQPNCILLVVTPLDTSQPMSETSSQQLQHHNLIHSYSPQHNLHFPPLFLHLGEKRDQTISKIDAHGSQLDIRLHATVTASVRNLTPLSRCPNFNIEFSRINIRQHTFTFLLMFFGFRQDDYHSDIRHCQYQLLTLLVNVQSVF